MPLPNRVSPFGELFADPARGLFLGNRGGRFHREDRSLPARRWVSRAWICCRLAFKERRREVWGRGYTELFFLDEPTALAAGHRACFECRRSDAVAFAAALGRALHRSSPLRAGEIDAILHAERLDGRTKRRHGLPIHDLPDGAFLTLPGEDGIAYAVRGDCLLRWSPAGYGERRPRPRGLKVDVLTPPAVLGAFRAGYAPIWHPSAELR
jgi:hypothetical protein